MTVAGLSFRIASGTGQVSAGGKHFDVTAKIPDSQQRWKIDIISAQKGRELVKWRTANQTKNQGALTRSDLNRELSLRVG